MYEHSDTRHGAARWAEAVDLHRARLIRKNLLNTTGIYHGEFARQHIIVVDRRGIRTPSEG